MAISATTPHAIDSRHGYAMLLMVAGSVAISFGGLVQRNIEIADPWQINVYRSLGMLIAASIIIGVRHRGNLFDTLTGIGRLGLLGGVLLSIAGIAFVQALTHTTVANALFILGSIPFFAALFARLILGERLRRATLITMIVAAMGLGIMVLKGISVGSGFGNLMALLTAVSFAAYAIIVRYKRQVEMIPVILLSSAIIIVISLLVAKGDIAIPLNDILLCLFWGGCLSGFVNWMFIIASRHLATAEVTLIMLLEFALGPIWVWWFIGETPTAWTIFGGGLIIIAVALRSIFELINKPKREQTPRTPV
ncbi:MAG: DMT family transporter [Gammaproteobacteria bacterium]|nr:DMT family transporter [Gammaproteobacteria bacterium]